MEAEAGSGRQGVGVRDRGLSSAGVVVSADVGVGIDVEEVEVGAREVGVLWGCFVRSLGGVIPVSGLRVLGSCL